MKYWIAKLRLRELAAVKLLVSAVVFWHILPEPLFDEPVSFVLEDRAGELMGAKIADDEQWRFPPATTVPDKFGRCLIAFEDKRFHRHPGFDPLALARAFAVNLSRGKVVSGGSTLTMQVIRLARDNPPRTYWEKLIELVMAVRLEVSYSKEEILALYASHAPFGGNVIGLEAASWRYFGRAPGKLSWAESAMLAVLPNSPALIHPGRKRAALRKKRDDLLHSLHRDGVLGDLDLDLALREPLPEEPVPLPRMAPHLLETLIADAGVERRRFGSTLDSSLQRAANEIVTRHAGSLGLQGIHNAAALLVDNRSFEVLAYVGNAEWSVANELGFAVDIVQRPRSSGSILKPFLFAAMLQAGEILPKTLVPDVPTQYSGYMPENFDQTYRGAVPAQDALARSLNVPAVRMLKQHGVGRFYDFLRHLGMTTLTRPPEDYGLTLILGGAEATVWDMTGMYANLADLARHARSGPKVTYRKLKLLQREDITTDRLPEIGPGAAWLTLNALLEVARPGEEGHWRNFANAHKVAWKTGTSFGHRDAWAIGSTSRYTAAVWVGNASGEGRPGLTGTTTAAPILFDLFNRLDKTEWFAQPYLHMKEVETCRNDGYLASGRCEKESQWVPRDSHFDRLSPHNRLVHINAAQRFRVHGACESPGNMVHRSWFVLSPGQEFYYRKHHAEYRPLPPLREDCRRLASVQGSNGPIDFLYPNFGTRLFIPVDLGEEKSQTVFEAAHRRPDATLYWHLDQSYLGATTTFHQQALNITPGTHVVTVVDEQGNRLARRFEVLDKARHSH